MENKIDKEVQKESLVVAVGAAMFLFTALKNIFFLFKESKQLLKASQIHPKLTDAVRKIDSSKKWTCRVLKMEQINAFSVGSKDIYITNSLLEILTFNESVAVMLHEAGHVYKNHIPKDIVVNSTILGLMASLAVFFTSAAGGPLLVYFLFATSRIIGSITVRGFYLKTFEFQADNYAVRHGYGKELISSFKKIMKKAKIKEVKCTTMICEIAESTKEILSTHPRFSRRIEAIIKDMGKNVVKLLKLEPKQAALKAIKNAKKNKR